MNRYRVFGGVANIGPGVAILLQPDQIRSRAYKLELPKGHDPRSKDAKPAAVKGLALLQFKVGEVIGLEELPKNLIGICEPVDPPKTETDVKAADAALRKRNPKAHAELEKRRKAAKARAKTAGAGI